MTGFKSPTPPQFPPLVYGTVPRHTLRTLQPCRRESHSLDLLSLRNSGGEDFTVADLEGQPSRSVHLHGPVGEEPVKFSSAQAHQVHPEAHATIPSNHVGKPGVPWFFIEIAAQQPGLARRNVLSSKQIVHESACGSRLILSLRRLYRGNRKSTDPGRSQLGPTLLAHL